MLGHEVADPDRTHLPVGEQLLERQLPDSPGWTMFAFTAEPGTPSDERLKLLGMLTADTTAPTSDTAQTEST